MFELSDTRRGLLAQEDMLRFRLKFSYDNTAATYDIVCRWVRCPICSKYP